MRSVAIENRLSALASRFVAGAVADGAAVYSRRSVLPKLLPLAPFDVTASADPPDEPRRTRTICLLLARALRQERGRGRAGHWTYDVNRHLALLQAYRAERRELGRLSKPGQMVPPERPARSRRGGPHRSRPGS